MRLASLLHTILLIAALAAGLPVAAVSSVLQDQKQVSKIVEIHGTAYLRQDENAKAVKLHSKRDLGRVLHPGEKIRCEKGLLKIEINGKPIEIKPSAEWYPIPQVPKSPSSRPSQTQTGGRNASVPKKQSGTVPDSSTASDYSYGGKSSKKAAKGSQGSYSKEAKKSPAKKARPL